MTNDINKQLIKACIDGNLEEVNRLIAAGANLKVKIDVGGSLLMWAAQKGHAEIAKMLLAANVNPNTARNNGVSVLMAATLLGHAENCQNSVVGECRSECGD